MSDLYSVDDGERCVECGNWTVSHRATRPGLPPLCIACEGRERREDEARRAAQQQGEGE
jgi:hypothetical protein